MLAAGLNFLDVLACRGQYPNQPTPPFPIGVELAGEVTDGGDQTSLSPGTRVVGIAPLPLGALATHVTLPAWLVHPVPAGIEPMIAAALPVNYQTAHFALHRLGRLRAGETLLVQAAAGGVGTATIQLATAAGATVIALAGSDEKAERCRGLGATLAFDSHRPDLLRVVLEATDGRGADVVVDSVGGAAFEDSLALTAFEGRIVVVGFSSGIVPELGVDRLLARNVTISALSWGEHYPRRAPELVAGVYEDLFAMLAAGMIAPHVETVPFDRVPVALDRLAGRRTTGKLVCAVAP